MECLTRIIREAGGLDPEAIGLAEEKVRAGVVNEAGRLSLACERCGANFTIKARSGPYAVHATLWPLTEPQDGTDACYEVIEATEMEVGISWVTKISPKWFSIDLLTPEQSVGVLPD